jgi:hypothetical protein
MAIKVRFQSDSPVENSLEHDVIDTASKEEYVSIQSAYSGIIIIKGSSSNKLYTFERAGSIVQVIKEDADEILKRDTGKSCCGGSSNSKLFEIVR